MRERNTLNVSQTSLVLLHRAYKRTTSSGTSEIADDADDVDFKHSRSFEVIRCCGNQCGIYDFLLALNSNLTCVFNRS